jgi:RNA polymerase sigma-70 factor, ECF subfamily
MRLSERSSGARSPYRGAMSAAPPGDDELLARHVNGDPDAFNELVVRHRDRLWAVALRTLGQPEDAADALQDALLSAYRGAAGFRGGSAVTTWLHRIVVNACLDLARRRAVRPTEPLLVDPAAEPAERDVTSQRETSLLVLAALRTLPPEQAAAVVLVDIEGFGVNEAAEILDVPSGTVKSRCARARARLAETLSDLDPRRPAGEADAGNDPAPARVQPEMPTREEPA